MTTLETALLARIHTDRKVKAASGRLGQARRWAAVYPHRWTPERIRGLEAELDIAKKELSALAGRA